MFRTAILSVFLLAGCNAMQATPVAPSAVSPEAPSVGPQLPTFTAFDVTLSNGTDPTTTFAGNTWLGFLSIQPRAGAWITIPARARFECGDGTALELGTGTGRELRVTCLFMSPGLYLTRATVEAQNGETTIADLAVRVLPQPPDTRGVTVNLDAAPDPVTPSIWIFTPTTTGPVVSLTWSFGDGGQTLTNGPGAVMSHRYGSSGIYVVTATPRLPDGSSRAPGRVEILIP